MLGPARLSIVHGQRQDWETVTPAAPTSSFQYVPVRRASPISRCAITFASSSRPMTIVHIQSSSPAPSLSQDLPPQCLCCSQRQRLSAVLRPGACAAREITARTILPSRPLVSRAPNAYVPLLRGMCLSCSRSCFLLYLRQRRFFPP